MNTPVSFEIAKLLKEKGFDVPIHSYYYNEGKDYFESKTGKFNHNDGLYVSAPTIAEVVMWLYENHKIWINVGGDSDYKFKYEIHTWKWYEHEKCYRLGHVVLGDSFWDTSSSHFNSPTEAYEAAIMHCLVFEVNHIKSQS